VYDLPLLARAQSDLDTNLAERLPLQAAKSKLMVCFNELSLHHGHLSASFRCIMVINVIDLAGRAVWRHF
jgi:hypothetical protein